MQYNVTRTIVENSREELAGIFRWVRDHREGSPRQVTVLIGGWAVYCYNPWYGSVDIDIITNSKTRQHLMKFLRDERGFVPQRYPFIRNTVVKNSPEGSIIIDFGSREDICRFEGRSELCPFSLIDNQTEARSIEIGGNVVEVIIPTRALLVLYKLKAAWDRSQRLLTGTSPDTEWETGKLTKDRADVLALLDPASGGTDIDVFYLGSQLSEYPFLIDVLRSTANDSDAVAMYRRLNTAQARDVVERIISLMS
ncbi:MAG: hypothetical protein M0Q91_08845 [Methanoregula sp.]|nr:hypothetical protein [Methanoregula sp.]